jgi:hypothetical protein
MRFPTRASLVPHTQFESDPSGSIVDHIAISLSIEPSRSISTAAWAKGSLANSYSSYLMNSTRCSRHNNHGNKK